MLLKQISEKMNRFIFKLFKLVIYICALLLLYSAFHTFKHLRNEYKKNNNVFPGKDIKKDTLNFAHQVGNDIFNLAHGDKPFQPDPGDYAPEKQQLKDINHPKYAESQQERDNLELKGSNIPIDLEAQQEIDNLELKGSNIPIDAESQQERDTLELKGSSAQQEKYNLELLEKENTEQEEANLQNESLDVPSPQNTSQLVYTRVLKCGSTSMWALIKAFAEVKGFNTQYEMTWTIQWNMTEACLTQKVEYLQHVPAPWIYVRHVHFIDFLRYGSQGSSSQPGYFGIVRDPVERIVSWYYYRLKQYNPMQVSLDECVAAKYPQECVKVHSRDQYNFALIPFFCGHDPVCLYPNNRSLAIAMENVQRHYAVVGLSEDYARFLQVLEYMFPGYFAGISDFYHQEQKKAVKNITHRKREVSQKTKDTIKSQLGLEYDFYYFIKNRFDNLYDKLLKQGKISASFVLS